MAVCILMFLNFIIIIISSSRIVVVVIVVAVVVVATVLLGINISGLCYGCLLSNVS
jgi:hypothetical protein